MRIEAARGKESKGDESCSQDEAVAVLVSDAEIA